MQAPTRAAAARVAATLQDQSVAQQRERMRKADQIILLALQQVRLVLTQQLLSSPTHGWWASSMHCRLSAALELRAGHCPAGG